MQSLPTGDEWRRRMTSGDPSLYRELVRRFGFEFALGRWLAVVKKISKSDPEVVANRPAIEAIFRRKIGLEVEASHDVDETREAELMDNLSQSSPNESQYITGTP